MNFGTRTRRVRVPSQSEHMWLRRVGQDEKYPKHVEEQNNEPKTQASNLRPHLQKLSHGWLNKKFLNGARCNILTARVHAFQETLTLAQRWTAKPPEHTTLSGRLGKPRLNSVQLGSPLLPPAGATYTFNSARRSSYIGNGIVTKAFCIWPVTALLLRVNYSVPPETEYWYLKTSRVGHPSWYKVMSSGKLLNRRISF